MGTTYQLPNLASYETHPLHHHSSFAPSMAQQDRTRSTAVDSVYNSASRYPSETQQLSLPHPRTSTTTFAPAAPHSARSVSSRHSADSSTPGSVNAMTSGRTLSQADQGLSLRDSAMVLHNLNIPSCISPKGGNLVEFAAQITALFWFESIKTLETAERVRTLAPGMPIRRLTENAIASAHFRKWVQSVLTTTQVTQNVILLALMFIYRLKVANPTVRGRPGSEYRLLTVALMLGNKFLDDNTYTNKTWAEVSGIAVGEIHVMEVEFLSNMRYSLLASKDQWEEWLVKLAKFWEYCERAEQPASPLLIPSPTQRAFASPLPSPTGNLQLPPTYQLVHAGSKADQSWQTAYQASSPLSAKPELQARKRPFPEDDLTEGPAKRVSRQLDASRVPRQHVVQQQATSQPAYSRPEQEQLRLPVPNLSLNTTNMHPIPPPAAAVTNFAPHQASALSLPPLVAGVRAMATVYPTTSTAFAPQLSIPATSGPAMPSAGVAVTPTSTYPPLAYGTPTKRMSPQSALTPAAAAAAYNSSPLTENFAHHALTPLASMGSASGAHTPIGNSPSIYLQQRPSPYKPVRHVNTLLYPPPSAFLQQYHLATAVQPNQMHYQPLGRRNEYRTGIVPEFALATHGPLGALGGHHHAVTPVTMPQTQQLAQNQVRPAYAPSGARPAPSAYPPN